MASNALTASGARFLSLALYGAVFIGAFLLFQIQPMMAKRLLPMFGGSYLVWGACTIFFQSMLVVGYAWAHGAQQRLGVARYAPWHLLLLAAPLALLAVQGAPHEAVAPQGPLLWAVTLLLATAVGLPFLALSTTSLVLQRWLAASRLPGRENPYVLYAVSNAGSLLALISYPFLVEPYLGLASQWRVWWIGYGVYLLLHAVCLLALRGAGCKGQAAAVGRAVVKPVRTPLTMRCAWLGLAAAGSGLSLAVTNLLTFDVAAVPLLWILPLSVYLLTFILIFKRRPWVPAWLVSGWAWAAPVGALVYLLTQMRQMIPLPVQLALHLGILFLGCMAVHGRLAAMRPREEARLTTYYVSMSIGGLLGSLFVCWLVPVLSRSLVEYPLMLAAVALALGLTTPAPERAAWRWGALPTWGVPLGVLVALTLVPWLGAHVLGLDPRMAAGLLAIPLLLALRAAKDDPRRLAAGLLVFAAGAGWAEGLTLDTVTHERLRNFYGIYRVFDQDGVRYLQHGTTQHGRQSLDPAKAATPMAYFHPTTPAAGVLLDKTQRFEKIAMIGLGTGALAAYMGDGQQFTIYELDPDNLPVAERHFSYLQRARDKGAALDFVFGDGRVRLREKPAATYDLLIIDAFSSGAIPAHLLTVEALQEYFRVLKPNGLLLMHVSNKYLNLPPVVFSLARACGLRAATLSNSQSIHPDADLTVWMALSRDETTWQALSRLGWYAPSSRMHLPAAWTDDSANLLAALNR